jgi:hypothetical protein
MVVSSLRRKELSPAGPIVMTFPLLSGAGYVSSSAVCRPRLAADDQRLPVPRAQVRQQVIKGRAFQVPVQRPVQANRQVIGVSRDGKDGSVIAQAPSGRVAGP